MFGRRAADLIRSLDRASEDAIPPYNAEAIRAVCEEIKELKDSNTADVSTNHNALLFRHIAIERNIRCLIAYHHNRLERIRNLRWSLGGIIPREIRAALSEKEIEWFNNYNLQLADYMMTLQGLDLTVHQRPPQDVNIHVLVLMDYGNYETEDGETIFLKKNTRHVLPRTECEHLIRQGVLEHVPS